MINQLRPGGLFYISGRIDDAHDLCKRHHYSGRMCINPAVRAVMTAHKPGGLFGDQGPAVAACVFAVPSSRWDEDLWELHRLVAIPDWGGSLSSLVSAAVDHVRRSRRIDLLVSYADATQGHHGGIYQAASWRYSHQSEKRMDGVMLGDAFIPGRAANHAWGTRSPSKLSNMGVDAVAHYDEGKHLYWRSFGVSGRRKAERLGLRDAPYPKPDAVEAGAV